MRGRTADRSPLIQINTPTARRDLITVEPQDPPPPMPPPPNTPPGIVFRARKLCKVYVMGEDVRLETR